MVEKLGFLVECMNLNQSKDFISIPLKDLLHILLGTEISSYLNAKVPLITGEILFLALKDSQLYHIQFDDHAGVPLPSPIIWRKADWLNSAERYAKQKAYSEKLRIESFIRQTNEENVSHLLCKEYGFDEDNSKIMAMRLVRGASVEGLKGLGLKKVITKESEL